MNVLFLCTGNYYRSRYAEALFNHLAREHDYPGRATSRGLAIHLAEGDLSPHTQKAMWDEGLDRDLTGPTRVALAVPDLETADRIIALKEAEHRALLREQFPEWEHRVEYWHVHDLDRAGPDVALPRIRAKVTELFNACRLLT